MQKPSERHKFTSENNIIKFKKPVHNPFKAALQKVHFRNVHGKIHLVIHIII